VDYKAWLKAGARTKPTGRRKGQKRGKIRKPTPLGPVTINHHLRAAKRLLNWCVNHEPPLLHRNPLRSLKLEEEQGRERVITNEEFAALLTACTSEDQRDLLRALRLTAARPEDVRRLTWGMVKWDSDCWVLQQHKTKGTRKDKKPRIVPMVEEVESLLKGRWERLGKPGTDSHVFFNEDGRPWDSDDLSQWFRRLREWAGVTEKDGENVVLYSARHTRLTDLAPHLNPHLLQQVAGHTTFVMTQRYLHVAQEEVLDALREAEKKRQSPK
jgi:integrase